MEFLHPKMEDETRMILLLLVSKDRNTYAVCYEWDASETLRETPPRVVRRQMPSEYRLPSMIVPLARESSFLLMAATSMAVYDMLGPMKQASRYQIHVPVEEQENQRTPLWVQWARPNREYLHRQFHDDIFLCRHDGEVLHVAIGNSKGDVEFQTYLGSVGCGVDAFDVLNTDVEGGDLLLAAGIMGDGGLFVRDAGNAPHCVQRLFNWAPVVDSVFVNGDRLFACSASSSSAPASGALVEFRYGIEAQIGLFAAQDELSHARDMWAMTENLNGGTYVLTSDPESSLLIYIPRDCGEIDTISESQSGLNHATQTLAAALMYTGTGTAIAQVTDKAIHVGVPDGSSLGRCLAFDDSENCICATINRTGSLILAAVRSHFELFLRLAKVEDGSIGTPVKIDFEPVSLIIEEFGHVSFAFIGTSDGRIVIYNLVERNAVFLSCYPIVDMIDDDMSKAIESITCVTAHDSRATLFCGLRNGYLVPFDVHFDQSSMSILIISGNSSVF